jgi:iron-sulfur cluster assembly accessory protein
MSEVKMSVKEKNIDENISITKKAATRIKGILDAEKKQGHALRLSVVGGGCSGMNYNIAFDDNKGEFDKVYRSKGVDIYCDLQSWLYLKGTAIDFSDDILSGGFKITNPNASRTCGCGTSFSV